VETGGAPAAGTGLGGSFKGGSLTGEGVPDEEGGFWDGASLTGIKELKVENMTPPQFCQSRSMIELISVRRTRMNRNESFGKGLS
jgi:hypothetical protein